MLGGDRTRMLGMKPSQLAVSECIDDIDIRLMLHSEEQRMRSGVGLTGHRNSLMGMMMSSLT